MNGEAVVLGFDTSCYTTSVAAVDLAGRPVASCRRLLPVPAGSAACGRARPCLSMCVSYRCFGGIGSAHPRLHYCSGVRIDTAPG